MSLPEEEPAPEEVPAPVETVPEPAPVPEQKGDQELPCCQDIALVEPCSGRVLMHLLYFSAYSHFIICGTVVKYRQCRNQFSCAGERNFICAVFFDTARYWHPHSLQRHFSLQHPQKLNQRNRRGQEQKKLFPSDCDPLGKNLCCRFQPCYRMGRVSTAF